jgi:hypothetical protein
MNGPKSVNELVAVQRTVIEEQKLLISLQTKLLHQITYLLDEAVMREDWHMVSLVRQTTRKIYAK